MPTNLPPDYFQIERRFREAETVEEKIELLKEMMSVVPKHKGTDHLRADLRRKLAKLNDEAQSHKSTAKHDSVFRVPKAGAGQVILVGPADTGKTTLLKALTTQIRPNETGHHPTFEPAPAMMSIDDIQLQLVDTPPLSRDYVEPRLKDLIRRADLVVIVVDLHQDPIEQLHETVDLLKDFRIAPTLYQDNLSTDPSMTFLPFVVLVNKCDNDEDEELYNIFCELNDEPWTCLPASALEGRNLQRFKNEVYTRLGIIRVYTKVPGKEPDFATPFVFHQGDTVEELAGRIHKEVLQSMKSARVWGKTVYDGQKVSKNYILQDGDVVEIHT